MKSFTKIILPVFLLIAKLSDGQATIEIDSIKNILINNGKYWMYDRSGISYNCCPPTTVIKFYYDITHQFKFTEVYERSGEKRITISDVLIQLENNYDLIIFIGKRKYNLVLNVRTSRKELILRTKAQDFTEATVDGIYYATEYDKF